MNPDRRIWFPEHCTIYVADDETSNSQSPPVSNHTLLGNKHNLSERGKKEHIGIRRTEVNGRS